MTYPNPAGYYGLKMPEAIESEITTFSKDKLMQTFYDLASYYNRDYSSFAIESVYPSCDFDDFVNPLNQSELIALIRWVTERLAWLEKQEKATDAQP